MRTIVVCHVSPMFVSLNFDIGISDPFQDIYSAQLYYLQACSALENGRLFAPSEHFYLFQDYALTELIINALGRFPIEMYYSDGFRKLLEHDAASSVSYIETLRTYLDKNMSITKTTACLYINRSTLLEENTVDFRPAVCYSIANQTSYRRVTSVPIPSGHSRNGVGRLFFVMGRNLSCFKRCAGKSKLCLKMTASLF